jgi:hypothetical protein
MKNSTDNPILLPAFGVKPSPHIGAPELVVVEEHRPSNGWSLPPVVRLGLSVGNEAHYALEILKAASVCPLLKVVARVNGRDLLSERGRNELV